MRHTPVHLVRQGQFGLARAHVAANMTGKRSDRQYLLDRIKLAVLMLADGYPNSAQLVFEEVYEVLSTRGINQDKTVDAVVAYEGVKFWKGEPFEQALALFYYAVQQAELGQWDNARAAASNSLFRLRDFGGGERINTTEVVRRAVAYERAQARGEAPAQQGDFLDHGYAVRDSNFALGYLMHGIASMQLGRREEASDHLHVAAEVNPELQSLVPRLLARDTNMVLIVSHGLGPRKIAYGPDNAFAGFEPRSNSGDEALLVRPIGGQPVRVPVACDVNEMALDHMWNSLEEIRAAKSAVGNVLLYGGLAAAAVGSEARSDEAVYAGLGAMAAGLLAKAGAHADTRHVDAFPQRLYVVPLNLSERDERVELMIEGMPGTRMVLTGLRPTPGQVQLRYVRLVPGSGPQALPPAWAVSGEVHYANDADPDAVWPQLPYILGGRSVRTPTDSALSDYQRSGFLHGFTTAELRQLYDDEDLTFDLASQKGRFEPHVLEGGRSMVAPLGGTTGYVRLFGQSHPPYQPRSAHVRELAGRIQTQGQAARLTQGAQR